jgi:hypothetical protein
MENRFIRNSSFKASSKPMKRSAMKRVPGTARSLKPGRKTKQWNATRRKLVSEFAAMGITSCELRYEGCFGEGALGFAHGRKRRHLKGDELKTLVILICNPCHDRIEFLPAEEMLRIIQEVIEKRKANG